MTDPKYKRARNIQERIHVSGQLVLETPAHFGNGAVRSGALLDMTLITDEFDGRPMIPGTTIAGALRSYLRERLHGYGEEEASDQGIGWLFGTKVQTDEGEQSLLIIEDALAHSYSISFRDGVRIDSQIGIAQDQAKFDFEVLEAGSCFDLHFELALTPDHPADQLLPLLAAALQGFESGEIRLGLRKRRGYGQCKVMQWQVSRYNLMNPIELCGWLETPSLDHRQSQKSAAIVEALHVAADSTDSREQLRLTAQFGLQNSSILIRSGFGESNDAPDFVHLHAKDRDGNLRPVIPGTSWTGVIRHRALRIANTIADSRQIPASDPVPQLINQLFGDMPTQAGNKSQASGHASKVQIDETVIENGHSLYQTRVRIDRFTGGALDTALFEEAPVYGTAETRVTMNLHVRNPERYEIGLLLLILKDLWTGDLPIGGETSVGRGRLQGHHAEVAITAQSASRKTFVLTKDLPALGLSKEAQQTLQSYVDELWQYLQKGLNDNADAK